MAGAAVPQVAPQAGGGIFQSLLGTAGLPKWQQALAGLQAASPLFQRQQAPGGLLANLMQGIGQARSWAGAQRGLPQAPRVPNITPGQIPGPVAMPQILPPPPNIPPGMGGQGYELVNQPAVNFGFGRMS